MPINKRMQEKKNQKKERAREKKKERKEEMEKQKHIFCRKGITKRKKTEEENPACLCNQQ